MKRLLAIFSIVAAAILGLPTIASAAISHDIAPDPLVAADDATVTLNIDVQTTDPGTVCEFYNQTNYLVTYTLTNVDDPSQEVVFEIVESIIHDGTYYNYSVDDTETLPNLPGAWTLTRNMKTSGGVSTVANPNYVSSPFPQPCGRLLGTATSSTSVVQVAENAIVPVVHLPTTVGFGLAALAGFGLFSNRKRLTI